jgi:hypothetical protein
VAVHVEQTLAVFAREYVVFVPDLVEQGAGCPVRCVHVNVSVGQRCLLSKAAARCLDFVREKSMIGSSATFSTIDISWGA